MPSLLYAGHEEVADLVKNGVPGKDYLVVDVRDEDFEGGNIVGARNYPSATFMQSMDELVAETQDVPKVIFHCALSQQRGPKMARIYADELERRGAKVQLANAKEEDRSQKKISTEGAEGLASESTSMGKTTASEQEVIVLRGGFTRWQEKYKNDPKLVEKWKASIWAGSSL